MSTAATLQRTKHRQLGIDMTASTRFARKLRLHLAFTAAQALAWAVSLARPIRMHTDDEGNESPHVYAVPLVDSSWWRVDLWRSEPGCIEARIFGCAMEVFYVPKGTAGAACEQSASA